jgi:hypothetical protein
MQTTWKPLPSAVTVGSGRDHVAVSLSFYADGTALVADAQAEAKRGLMDAIRRAVTDSPEVIAYHRALARLETAEANEKAAGERLAEVEARRVALLEDPDDDVADRLREVDQLIIAARQETEGRSAITRSCQAAYDKAELKAEDAARKCGRSVFEAIQRAAGDERADAVGELARVSPGALDRLARAAAVLALDSQDPNRPGWTAVAEAERLAAGVLRGGPAVRAAPAADPEPVNMAV